MKVNFLALPVAVCLITGCLPKAAVPTPAPTPLLELTALADNAIKLTINDATDEGLLDTWGWGIMRKDSNNTQWVVVGSVPGGATEFVDQLDVLSNTQYSYKIYKYDDSSILPEAAESSVTSKNAAALNYIPNAATSLAATPQDWKVSLSWDDNADNENNIVIKRSTDDITYNSIATLAPNTQSFIDYEVQSSQNYYYKIAAVNNQAGETLSNAVSVTTLTDNATAFSGTVSTDQTLAAGVYSVASNIIVDAGVTLTISAGSTLIFNGSLLDVSGNLVINGTAAEPVILRGLDTSLNNAWSGISIKNQSGASSIIKHARISNANEGIRVQCCNTGGPIKTYDSYFVNNRKGSASYTGFVVPFIRTHFKDQAQGSLLQADAHAYYSVFENSAVGASAVERTTVKYSVIINKTSGFAFYVSNSTKSEGNYFSGNLVSIAEWRCGYLKYNTFYSAIETHIRRVADASCTVESNNFGTAGLYSYENDTSGGKTITDNWFGSSDSNVIDAVIFDMLDDGTKGLVSYDTNMTQAISVIPLAL